MNRFESIFAKSSTVLPSRLLRRALRAVARPIDSIYSARIVANFGSSSRDHIYLLGVPRAGTSLLSTILSCHRSLSFAGDETQIFLLNNFIYKKLPNLSEIKMRELLRAAKSRVEFFDLLADHYLELQVGTERFLEKTPEHAFHLERLYNVYPNAQFIFSAREPRDAYASICRSRNLPDPSLDGYAASWNSLTSNYFLFPKKRVHLVRYEDLVRDPDSIVSEVCSFINVDYEQTMLDPEMHAKMSGSYRLHDYHARIGEPISPKSIGSWKKTLCQDDADQLFEATKESARKLGYVNSMQL